MSGLEKALFNLKVLSARNIPHHLPRAHSSSQFTAKQLNRQAAKAGKDEQAEKSKLEKVPKPPRSAFYTTSATKLTLYNGRP